MFNFKKSQDGVAASEPSAPEALTNSYTDTIAQAIEGLTAQKAALDDASWGRVGRIAEILAQDDISHEQVVGLAAELSLIAQVNGHVQRTWAASDAHELHEEIDKLKARAAEQAAIEESSVTQELMATEEQAETPADEKAAHKLDVAKPEVASRAKHAAKEEAEKDEEETARKEAAEIKQSSELRTQEPALTGAAAIEAINSEAPTFEDSRLPDWARADVAGDQEALNAFFTFEDAQADTGKSRKPLVVIPRGETGALPALTDSGKIRSLKVEDKGSERPAATPDLAGFDKLATSDEPIEAPAKPAAEKKQEKASWSQRRARKKQEKAEAKVKREAEVAARKEAKAKAAEEAAAKKAAEEEAAAKKTAEEAAARKAEEEAARKAEEEAVRKAAEEAAKKEAEAQAKAEQAAQPETAAPEASESEAAQEPKEKIDLSSFREVYVSRDGSIALYEDADGHITAVNRANLA